MGLGQLLYAGIFVVFGATLTSAAADDFPTKPVRLVVPYAAGSTTDLLGRSVAQHLQQTLGQPVIVENKPGGATMIGAETVASAVPDGYTLLLATTGTANNTVLYKKVPYKLSSFAAVAPLALTPSVLAVNAQLPAQDLKSFIAYAKSRPGELNYADIGKGGLIHLATERFKAVVGIDLVEVNFPGSGQGQTALAGNHVQVFFDSIPSAVPVQRTGATRILAITSKERTALLPDVPTFAELGYPELTNSGWYGFLAPAGTPEARLTKLRSAIDAAVKSPQVIERLTLLGAEPVSLSSAEFDAYIERDVAYWGEVAKRLNISFD